MNTPSHLPRSNYQVGLILDPLAEILLHTYEYERRCVRALRVREAQDANYSLFGMRRRGCKNSSGWLVALPRENEASMIRFVKSSAPPSAPGGGGAASRFPSDGRAGGRGE